MRILGIVCLIFWGLLACVKQSGPVVPSTTADLSASSSPEVLELSAAYGNLMSFWEDPVFIAHGFTANSPYADWLSYVHSLQNKPGYSSTGPRLLAMLAVACKQYGLSSTLTQDFKSQFEEELGHLRTLPYNGTFSNPSSRP